MVQWIVRHRPGLRPCKGRQHRRRLSSEKRIGRTLFEYEFRITVQNGASARTGLKAQLTAAGAGTTIVQGDVAVAPSPTAP